MSEFIVTDPTGKEHVVTAPDGATPDQALTYAKQQFDSETNGKIPLSQRAQLPDIADLITKGAYEFGGTVTDLAAKVLSPETAAKVGFAANVATQAIPMFFGGQAAGTVAAPGMRSGAESLMRSALKPPLSSLKGGNDVKAISTMLDEGINVSKGGVEKLRGLISGLNQEIMQAIQSSPATIDKTKVASELMPIVAKFEKQVTPNADVKAIESTWNEFLNHPLLSGSNDIPVQLAQELKQGTYSILKGKYGEVGSASTEAQKTLARGLKEGIAQAVPEVAGLNAKESALLNALQMTERRALIEGNKNLGGITWLSHNPAVWAAFMVDRSSAFKSAIARIMNAGQYQIPATATRLGIAGYETTKQNEQNSAQ